MKLKHLIFGLFAMFAFTLTFSACNSDDEPTAEVEQPTTTIPDEIVGEWDFNGFVLYLQKESGSLAFDNGSNAAMGTVSSYKTFDYSYTASKKELVCKCSDGTSFTLQNVHIDNGNLVITHDLTGAEKTETGTKHVEDTYYAPAECVGSWDFADFRLTIDKKSNGVVEYSDGSNLASTSVHSSETSSFAFTYTYNEKTRTLTCKSEDLLKQFTLSDVHLDSNGNLVLTHNLQGGSKTESAAKHVFAAVTKDQLLGTWYRYEADMFTFTADKATVYTGDEGTWRVDGSSVYFTFDGAETEILKNIEISGNTMKCLALMPNGMFKPFTLTRQSESTSEISIDITKLYGKTWVWEQLGSKMSLTFKPNGTGTCVTVDEDGTENSTFAWTYNKQSHVMTITDDENLNGTMTITKLTDTVLDVIFTMTDEGQTMSMPFTFYVEE